MTNTPKPITAKPSPLIMFAALNVADRVLACGDTVELAREAALDRLAAQKNPAPHLEHLRFFPITHAQVGRIERGQDDAIELEIVVRPAARGGFSTGVYDEKFLRDYLAANPGSAAGYIGSTSRQPRIDVQLEALLRDYDCADAEIAWLLCSLAGRHLADAIRGFAGSPAQTRDRIDSFLRTWKLSPQEIHKLAARDA